MDALNDTGILTPDGLTPTAVYGNEDVLQYLSESELGLVSGGPVGDPARLIRVDRVYRK